MVSIYAAYIGVFSSSVVAFFGVMFQTFDFTRPSYEPRFACDFESFRPPERVLRDDLFFCFSPSPKGPNTS